MMRALLRLRELILSGEFEPGDRMSELPLVERLGVSRTPVRLALAAARARGPAARAAGGGYVVREFTQADIRDAIELRGVLEGTAARFAAERGASRRELRALRAISEEIERARPPRRLRVVRALRRAQRALPRAAAGDGAQPAARAGAGGRPALPFASPSAFVLEQAELPESREILVVAHRQHLALIEAIEQRQGARAESSRASTRAWRSTNLEIVLRHRGVLEAVPGRSLLALRRSEPSGGCGADGARRAVPRSAPTGPSRAPTGPPRTISSAPGRYASSSGGLNGTGANGAPTRSIGASR